MMKQRRVNPKKVKLVKDLAELIKQYNVVGLAKLTKVPAKALHNLRDTLRGDVVIRMAKKRLVKRAFELDGRPNLIELADQIEGITALLLTNMNPLKLAKFLESKAVKGPAKPGDIAPIDIVVKAGDTKLAPGPIISELNQNLKVQTMIKNGTVHIRADTVTHKAGDLIDAKQAQLLARLGVEPITIKLDFYAAWEDGELIPAEVLHLNEEELLDNVRLAASQALNLALGLEILTDETIEPLVQRAARAAINVALELPIFIPDLLENYVGKAVREANTLQAAAFGIEETSSSDDNNDSSSEPEPQEEKSDDEEMGAGLAGLFG